MQETKQNDISKNKNTLIANGIFAFCLFVLTILFLSTNTSAYLTRSVLGAIVIACAVYNLVLSKGKFKLSGKQLTFSILVMIAVVFNIVSDILFVSNFALGASFVAASRMCLVSAFIVLAGFSLRDSVISVVIFALCFLIITINKNFMFYGYNILIFSFVAVISLMVGKSISNCFRVNNKLVYSFIVAGVVFLFLSDLFQIYYLFAGEIKALNILSVAFYYPAMFVLALSILIVNQNFISKTRI